MDLILNHHMMFYITYEEVVSNMAADDGVSMADVFCFLVCQRRPTLPIRSPPESCTRATI